MNSGAGSLCYYVLQPTSEIKSSVHALYHEKNFVLSVQDLGVEERASGHASSEGGPSARGSDAQIAPLPQVVAALDEP